MNICLCGLFTVGMSRSLINLLINYTHTHRVVLSRKGSTTLIKIAIINNKPFKTWYQHPVVNQSRDLVNQLWFGDFELTKKLIISQSEELGYSVNN